jgi:hypothetical protein
MLRKLRKKVLFTAKELDYFLGNKRGRKYYIEKNYKEMKLFKYLLFLRKSGANLNDFFDLHISNME